MFQVVIKAEVDTVGEERVVEAITNLIAEALQNAGAGVAIFSKGQVKVVFTKTKPELNGHNIAVIRE